MAVATNSNPNQARLRSVLDLLKTSWSDRRIRILVGVLAIAVAAAWYWFAAASATLTIAGHHGFRRAEVSVWIDGDLKSTYEVTGSAKKRFGILQKVEGNFSRSLRVGPGDHVVKLRFHSLTDSSDITRQCNVNVQAHTESTVYVNADRGLLSLSFAGSPSRTRPEPEPRSSYATTLQSIFMAIAGSALSATVGFVVQDFLKSRKAAAAKAVS
ncbi:MAG: hypothetical protein ACXVZV_06815 [Terriglobales bacterium]